MARPVMGDNTQAVMNWQHHYPWYHQHVTRDIILDIDGNIQV